VTLVELRIALEVLLLVKLLILSRTLGVLPEVDVGTSGRLIRVILVPFLISLWWSSIPVGMAVVTGLLDPLMFALLTEFVGLTEPIPLSMLTRGEGVVRREGELLVRA
jgi:hypothetical protein